MAATAVGPTTRLVSVLELLPCGAILLNRDGEIVYANPVLRRMARRSDGDLVGRSLVDLYPDAEARARIEQSLQTGFEENRNSEFFLPLPEGGQLPVAVSGGPVYCAATNDLYRLVTLIDISALKQAEQQAQEQYREVARLSDTVLEQALALQDHSRLLERRVRQRTRELHEANMEAITMLAVASEVRDTDTGAHVQRIRDYTIAIAREIGLPDAEIEELGYSAILHDVGKIHVPDDILKKPGPLTPEERRVIELHPEAGERILSQKPFFAVARQIARSHQENWDGTGYPDGLRGTEIPLAARIVRLVDVFDALSSARVYKPAWSLDEVIAAIRDGRGTLFDPQLVDALLGLIESGEWAKLRAA
jgi:PAS domain S-box-containing protein